MKYPLEHQKIVRELLNGKFVDTNSPLFYSLDKNKAFYHPFFEETYGYYLEEKGEYYYLTSTETTENGSRDFLLFLSLLCYEYHNRGKDIVHKISEGTFLIEEVIQYIEQSSKKGLLDHTQVINPKTGKLDVKRFLDLWEKRNLLEYTNNKKQFQFKVAINLFLQTAFALYEDHLGAREDG